MGLSSRTFGWLRDGLGNVDAAREIESKLGSLGAKQFFVSSVLGGAANDGLSWQAPLLTLAAALDLCTANQGDTIYLMPGHNEGIGNAQLHIDVAGVAIVGLGRGSARPRFDFDHANASIDVEANGCTLKNITLLPSVTDVLIGIDIEAAVTDTLLEDIEALPGEDAGGVDDFALVIDIKAGCTRTTVRGLTVRQHASGAGYIAGVRLTGASADCVIEDCYINIVGAGVVAPINGITTLSTNLLIANCVLTSDAEPGIELLIGTTGVIRDVDIFSNLATIAAATVADGMAHFRVSYIETGGESGAVVGTASVND